MAVALAGLFVAGLAAVLAAGRPAHASPTTGCQVSDKFPAKVFRWCPIITRYSEEANLHPDLVTALILQESGGNPRVISHSGAVGLMQVMPKDGTATKFMCKNGPCFSERPTTIELQDPEFNVRFGTRMLRELVDHYGEDFREALKAYGPTDVGYRYADIVLAIFKRYTQP